MTFDSDLLSCCSSCDTDCVLSDRKVQKILSQNRAPNSLNYEKGENVFKEGKPIVGFYVVCEGVVMEVSSPSVGNQITLNIFKAGDILTSDSFFFGEAKYQTRAETLNSAKILFIERSAFPEMMRVAGEKIGMKLAENMRYLRKNIEFSSYSVLKRTAYWLSKILPDSSNRFTISNKKLAEIIGCSHVTVSKKLSRLAEDDLIEKNGMKITVPDKTRLKEKAVRMSLS